MEQNLNLNNVKLIGRFEKNFELENVVKGRKIYSSFMLVHRLSGVVDRVPVCINEEQFKRFPKDVRGSKYLVEGYIITALYPDKIIVSVKIISDIIQVDNSVKDKNEVEIEGHVWVPHIRMSFKSERVICDFKLLCSSAYSKFARIPCIAWGNNAVKIYRFSNDTKVYIKGRFQNRIVRKLVNNTYCQVYQYELSVNYFEAFQNDTSKGY